MIDHRPRHPNPCTDPEDECIWRIERQGFEVRLREAAAYKARHGHEPPAHWESRHRSRFEAWQAALAACPGLEFRTWAETYRETVARDAADAFGPVDERRLRGARPDGDGAGTVSDSTDP